MSFSQYQGENSLLKEQKNDHEFVTSYVILPMSKYAQNFTFTVCFMHGLSIYEIKRICHQAYFFHNLIMEVFII